METHMSSPVIFLGGMLVGGVIGALGMLGYFKKKKTDTYNELVDENNELHDKILKLEEALESAVNNLSSVNDELKAVNKDAYSIEEYQRLYSGANESHETRDYTKYSGKIDPAEMESPSEEDVTEGEEEEDPEPDEEEDENYIRGEEMTRESAYLPGRRPKLISAESFDNEFYHFDKRQLYYYIGDDVLATEEEEEIHNIDKVVGDCLDKYGFRDPNSEERTIYVRNMEFATDYEIEKVFSRFSDLA